jgi:pimeloyl-ACP methyl ester carboxylesterase
MVKMPPINGPATNFFWWNIVAGALFAVVAIVLVPTIGLRVSAALDNKTGQVTWLTLFGGVFLMGCLFWWLLVTLPQRFSLWRGAVTGVLVSFFSYPVVIWLADIVQRDSIDIGASVERWNTVLLVTTLAVMTIGFATIPAMAVTGALIVPQLHPGTPPLAPRAQRPRSALALTLQRVALIAAIVISAFLVGAYAWLTLTPIDTAGLAFDPSSSAPAKTYEDAIAAFKAIQAEEAAMPLHKLCPSALLTHGQKVERVAIIFHGLTSCPAQGNMLAAQLFAQGYNVYLPRMVGHGEADPLTVSLAFLRAEDLVTMANRSVDMAHGLGNEVVVTGLSAGGTVASWVAQYRADTISSVPVSPFLGPHIVPSWATHAAINLTLMLPNMMLGWNPLETVPRKGTDYVYPHPFTHTLAQVMRMGAVVTSAAEVSPPAVPNIGVLLNAADIAVNNVLTNQLVASWRARGADIAVEVLPFSLHLPHDLINPSEPVGDTDLVYPIVIKMMNATAK